MADKVTKWSCSSACHQIPSANSGADYVGKTPNAARYTLTDRHRPPVSVCKGRKLVFGGGRGGGGGLREKQFL